MAAQSDPGSCVIPPFPEVPSTPVTLSYTRCGDVASDLAKGVPVGANIGPQLPLLPRGKLERCAARRWEDCPSLSTLRLSGACTGRTASQ